MNKLQKIADIYDAVANKETSMGCKIIYEHGIECEKIATIIDCDPVKVLVREQGMSNSNSQVRFVHREKILGIIGHPVMVGDCIQYANIRVSQNSETVDYTQEIEDVEMDIIRYFTEYDITKPIDEQTNECIDFIYNLIDDA